jgi:hypothetical protein
MKKLKVDWNAHLHGSASTLSELVAYQAATDAYGDAVDAYGDAVDAQWAALKADWAASAAYKAEINKTQKEETDDACADAQAAVDAVYDAARADAQAAVYAVYDAARADAWFDNEAELDKTQKEETND